MVLINDDEYHEVSKNIKELQKVLYRFQESLLVK
jgi:hypothetical protein